MEFVEYTIKVKVKMNDVSEPVIKSTGITLANLLPSALDHDGNSEGITISKLSGSVTLNVDCIESNPV